MRGWVVVLPILNELKELLCPPLLKQSHELTSHCLHLCSRYFGDPSIAVYIGCCNLLELEVSCDVCVYEHLCEFTIGHEELWDEVHCIVPVAADVCGDGLVRSKLLPELCEVEGCAFTSVAGARGREASGRRGESVRGMWEGEGQGIMRTLTTGFCPCAVPFCRLRRVVRTIRTL